MREREIRGKIYRLLRKGSWYPVTQTDAAICPACGASVLPIEGRPDILVPTVAVEVKALRLSTSKSFSFSEIKENQRRWLNDFAQLGFLGFIGLGVIDRRGSRDCLVSLFLVEWTQWLKIEERVRPIQNSIPYQHGKGMRRDLEGLDLLTLAAEWDVLKGLPEDHPAHR